MKYGLIVGFLVMVVLVSGCATQKQVQSSPPIASATNADITISGFAFNPSTLTVAKGASVVWINGESAKHTVVSDTGNEINSDALSKGQAYSHTFNTAGTYNYHCSIHPSMKGKVIVE